MADLSEEDLELDDGVLTDEEVVVPPVEVRVPPEWQSKMSTKSLSAVPPLPPDSLLDECCDAIEARVLNAGAPAVGATSLPSFIWDRLLSKGGGAHKVAEQALSAIINGVEASWTTHAAVQLFGELCGMLTAEHSEVVSRRVLALLDAEAGLVPDGASAVGAALRDDDANVPLRAALDALPMLRLSEGARDDLAKEVRKQAKGGEEGEEEEERRVWTTTATSSPLQAPPRRRPRRPRARGHLAGGRGRGGGGAEAGYRGGGGGKGGGGGAPRRRRRRGGDGGGRGGGGAEDGAAADDDEDDFEKDEEEEEAVEELAEEEAVEEEEEEAMEAAAEEEEEEHVRPPPAAPGGAPTTSSAAAPSAWLALAGTLSLGSDPIAVSQRQALFDRLDANADGQLVMAEVEGSLPEVLLDAGRPARAVGPLLADGVRRAFDAARGFSSSATGSFSAGGGAADAVSRDAFDRIGAYLHAWFVVLDASGVPSDAERAPPMGVDAVAAVLGRLPPTWGIVHADALAEIERLIEEGGGGGGAAEGEAEGEAALHAVAMMALHALLGAEPPPPYLGSPPGLLPSVGGVDGPPSDGHSAMGPGGGVGPMGLTPVLESTERSNFSTTGEWGKMGSGDMLTGGGSGSGGGGGMPPGGGGGSLGADMNMASVKVGFFDASALGDDFDDEGASDAAPTPGGGGGGGGETVLALRREVEELRAALARSQAEVQQQKARHRTNMQKMLLANEALQQQLKDLNGIVERVVQKSLGGGGGGLVPHPAAAAAPGAARLPDAFAPPAAAKPGGGGGGGGGRVRAVARAWAGSSRRSRGRARRPPRPALGPSSEEAGAHDGTVACARTTFHTECGACTPTDICHT